MESSPAVAGGTIQYTAMGYCKGRAEKRRVSHRSLPGDLQLASSLARSLAGHTVPRGPDVGGLFTSQVFPKLRADGPTIKIRAGIVFRDHILRLEIRFGTFQSTTPRVFLPN